MAARRVLVGWRGTGCRLLLLAVSVAFAVRVGDRLLRSAQIHRQVIAVVRVEGESQTRSQEAITEVHPDPEIGYVYRPGLTWTNNRFQSETNEHGMVGFSNRYERTKPKGARRILLIGDSVSRGAGARLGEDIATFLEIALNDPEMFSQIRQFAYPTILKDMTPRAAATPEERVADLQLALGHISTALKRQGFLSRILTPGWEVGNGDVTVRELLTADKARLRSLADEDYAQLAVDLKDLRAYLLKDARLLEFRLDHHLGRDVDLAKLFLTDPGRVEVLNGGVDGYDARNVAAWLTEVGFQFQPDIVIFPMCLNDVTASKTAEIAIPVFEDLTSVEQQGDETVYVSYRNVYPYVTDFGSPVWHRRQLKFSSWYGALQMGASRVAAWLDPSFEPKELILGLQYARDSLGKIVQGCRDRGIPLLLATVPYFDWEGDRYAHSEVHRWIAEMAAQQGVAHRDLLPDLRGRSAQELHSFLADGRIDTIHARALGNREIAHSLATELRSRGWMPAP